MVVEEKEDPDWKVSWLRIVCMSHLGRFQYNMVGNTGEEVARACSLLSQGL